MKNKTIALWLTLLGGPVGLHRMYLRGKFDGIAAALTAVTLIGAYGVVRARNLGVNDQLSWALIPLLGLTMTGCALNALVYGLMSTEKWNTHFNPDADPESGAGVTGKLTVAGLVTALFLGSTVLMACIAFSAQRYFEYQADVTQQPKQ